MKEHHIEVARTARYYTLGEGGAHVHDVWFVCHGYRQLAARFLNHFGAIDDGTRLIVAPEALSRFYLDDEGGPHGPDARVGATWMTREDRRHEIDDYVGYLDALYAQMLERFDHAAVAVHALGFSQGTATASRWAGLGSARIDHLVLWAGGIPPDLDWNAAEPRLRALRLTLVVGLADPHTDADRVAEQEALLADRGVEYRLIRFPGGHRLDAGVLRQLATIPRSQPR